MTDQHVTCELCAPPGPVARPRVLVIDDEEAIRSALGRALAAEGLVTDLAETAADGLSRARAEVYDLVILDLLMPGTDGSAVLRQLLRDRPGQPSWSCPAWPRCGCKVDCFDLGARDYLTKPFSRQAARPGPEVTGEFAWFGWHDPLRWRRGWAENRLLGDAGGLLMVVRGDRPLGFVNWRRHQATVAGFYWEIGIAMLPEARGHGDGTQAHRLLARYLFAHTTAHRIEASTETANLAERRALEKAGFTAEGSPAPSAGATANGATASPTASSAPTPPHPSHDHEPA